MNPITHDTRRAAHASVEVSDASTVHLLLQRAERPMGASEIAEALGWPITSVRPRLTELKAIGMVQVAAKRCKANGLQEATWEVAQTVFDERGNGMLNLGAA